MPPIPLHRRNASTPMPPSNSPLKAGTVAVGSSKRLARRAAGSQKIDKFPLRSEPTGLGLMTESAAPWDLTKGEFLRRRRAGAYETKLSPDAKSKRGLNQTAPVKRYGLKSQVHIHIKSDFEPRIRHCPGK